MVAYPAFAVFTPPPIKIFIGSYQVKFSLKILEFLFLSTLASELTSCWSPTRESRIISTLLSYYEVLCTPHQNYRVITLGASQNSGSLQKLAEQCLEDV